MHQLGEKLMFFVNDTKTANQLKKVGQIQSRDGPLVVLVKPSPPPKGGGKSDRQDSDRKFESAARGWGKGGLGSSDGDEIMEEDPTEVVKVHTCTVKVKGNE